MKKTFKLFVIAALAILSVSSCKKNDDDPTPSSNPSSPSGNLNTDGSYYPTTKGNSWTYEMSNGTVDYNATGNTKVVDGKTYYEVVQGGVNSGYVLREGNKYYSYSNTSVNGYPVTLNMKMIDLDVKVGETWKTVIQSNQYTEITYTMKLKDVGLTRTVKGVEYKDVIAIETVTTAKLINIPSGYEEMFQEYLNGVGASQVTYYAKNIGLIEQTSDMTQLQVALTKYTVK